LEKRLGRKKGTLGRKVLEGWVKKKTQRNSLDQNKGFKEGTRGFFNKRVKGETGGRFGGNRDCGLDEEKTF